MFDLRHRAYRHWLKSFGCSLFARIFSLEKIGEARNKVGQVARKYSQDGSVFDRK